MGCIIARLIGSVGKVKNIRYVRGPFMTFEQAESAKSACKSNFEYDEVVQMIYPEHVS